MQLLSPPGFRGLAWLCWGCGVSSAPLRAFQGLKTFLVLSLSFCKSVVEVSCMEIPRLRPGGLQSFRLPAPGRPRQVRCSLVKNVGSAAGKLGGQQHRSGRGGCVMLLSWGLWMGQGTNNQIGTQESPKNFTQAPGSKSRCGAQ